MAALKSYLTELIESCSRDLAQVTQRRMFGSNAFFTNGKIFALEWDDRIGVKLAEPAEYAALLALPGAQRWSPNGKAPMSKWLLVPESFHDDEDALAEWVRKAHQGMSAATVPVKKKRKK